MVFGRRRGWEVNSLALDMSIDKTSWAELCQAQNLLKLICFGSFGWYVWFGLFGLICLVWYVWFGMFGLVGFGLVGLVW